MTEAILTAVAVVALGAALRPRPPVRRVGPERHRSRSDPPAGAAGAARAAVHRRWRSPRPHLRPASGDVRAADVAAWCDALARSVRGGSSLATAISSTEAPPGAGDQVERVLLAVGRGQRLADALDVSTTSPHLDLAFTVLRACALQGGPPAEPLDRAAATLRGRAADAAERRSQSAQARLSALVMTVLPIAMLALLVASSSTTRAAVVRPVGTAAVVAGAGLNLTGWWWMRRIIGGVDR